MDPWLRPMLATTAVEVPTGDAWALEGKLDGYRFITHHRQDGRVAAYVGRNGSEYSGHLPYLEAELLACLPPDTAVDGELIGLGGGASGLYSQVSSVMGRNDPHVPTGDDPALTYMVFDLLRLDGHDIRGVPWDRRRELLELVEWDALCKTSPVGEASEESHQAMLDRGLEGSVVKSRGARYVNFRSPLWVKVKPQTTDEARVIGFKPGTVGTSNEGKTGALELEMLDSGARTRAAGFDDATQADIDAHPERWLGVVVEIKHHGLSKTGVPRSPNYLRRRDDRTPQPASARRERRSPMATATATPRMRNYGAMKDEKLLRCIAELKEGEGDAYERCVAKGGDPADDLTVAERVAQERGL